jgi:ParB-like chromosome segregation protein Spo0J
MATRLNVKESKRSDLFFLDPNEVKVKEELRGRRYQPTEEDVKARAVSMLTYGQLQPVVARRDNDSKPVLIAGFTRCAAARLIRAGFLADPDGMGDQQEFKDENFMLKVTISDCNDETAFVRNVVENAQRNETSAIDDAFNQEQMRDRYGMTDADIARTYGYRNAVKVCRFKKLLKLDTETQKLVHEGKLAVQAAIDILDLPEDERAGVLSQATRDNGRVNGAEVLSQIRDRQLAENPDDPDDPFAHIMNDDNRPETDADEVEEQEASRFKARNRREIVKFFANYREEYELAEALDRFCQDFVKYAEGRTTDQQMKNALDRIFEADPAA